jgi:hypothetical protein
MKPPSMKPRRLKVSYHQPISFRSEPSCRGLAPMPFLRLQGRWLGRAGFAVGASVRVEVSEGRLVLEVIEPRAPHEAAAGVT